MWFRISTKKNGGKISRFVQLCRSIRQGKVVRTKIIAHLGPYEEFIHKQAPGLLARLAQMTGQTIEETIFENGQDAGDALAMLLLWERIGLPGILKRHLPRSRVEFNVIKYIQCLVINRLCDPKSKLGIEEWLKGTHFPGLEANDFVYHHALRAMDWLLDRKPVLERQIADTFLGLFDIKVRVLFYDVTSSYFTSSRSIDPDNPEEIRDYGYSRDKRPGSYQVAIGLVMTEEGLPLCHYVFRGNTVDRATVAGMVEDIKKRFGIENIVLVGDRGMLSSKNLDIITDEELRFIISHPLRGDNAVCSVIEELLDNLKKISQYTDGPVYDETEYKGRRFVVSFGKSKAEDNAKSREQTLKKAQAFIDEKLMSLKRSTNGRMKKTRGRPATPQGTYDAIHDYLRDRRLLRLFKVTLSENRVVVEPNEENRLWEERIDGVVVVETTEENLTPSQIMVQYKNLNDVEQGFRTLKSSLDLRPNHHWTPKRIKAHIFICVIALQIARLMRRRFTGSSWSWEKAIERLRGIKTFTIKTGSVRRRGITVADSEQKQICRQLEIPFPQYRHLASRR